MKTMLWFYVNKVDRKEDLSSRIQMVNKQMTALSK